jgi:hypothetical protein
MKIHQKLQAAIDILSNFYRAYPYYKKVVDEYSNSVWAWDAELKIRKIEKLTPIYRKIILALKGKIEAEFIIN